MDSLGPIGTGFQQNGDGLTDLPEAGVGSDFAGAVQAIKVGREGQASAAHIQKRLIEHFL
jgi:phage-related protein